LLGFARYPSGAATFQRALSDARDARADVIGLCAFGPPLAAQIMPPAALGCRNQTRSAPMPAAIKDVHAMGPLEARDVWLVSDSIGTGMSGPRSFSRRFYEVTGRMPDKPYAATYAAVGHFLRIVESSDTIDGNALNRGMRAGTGCISSVPTDGSGWTEGCCSMSDCIE